MESLLTTKFHIPGLPDESVQRPRLCNKLLPSARVSLICAPAGFGKTTLAAAWLNRQNTATAWLSLDEVDNEIERFCSYVMEALNRAVPGVADPALKELRESKPLLLTPALTRLVNDLEQNGKPVVLALDDYHVIENREIHAAVSFLIGHQPRCLHLLLISRSEPPLSIAKLRAKNQLNELGTDELRFNNEETRDFLNRCMALNLTGEQVTRLERRSEGWVTALQLAALSLREQPEADAFIDSLSGEDRHIMDYLITEVISRQEQPVQEFLIQTSILKRMNAEICDGVLGITNSQQILEQLEQDNLFIVPLDNRRCWYRYHHLFAQMLQTRLQRRGRQQVAALHRRAASWFLEQSMWEETITHALGAEDYSQVIEYLETNIDKILARGRFNVYLQWFNRIPAEYMPPLLALHLVFFLHEMGEFEACEQWLERIEAQLGELTEESSAEEIQLHGILAVIEGIRRASVFDIDRARNHLQNALDLLPKEKSFWRVLALGGSGFCHRVSGNQDAAAAIYHDTAEMARDAKLTFCYFMYNIALAKLYMEFGQLGQAMQTCGDLLEYDATAGDIPFKGLAHVTMGQLQYFAGDLAPAEEQLTLGLQEIRDDGDAFSIFEAYFTLAWCRLDQDRPDRALETMVEMCATLDALSPPREVTIVAHSCTALIRGLAGQPESDAISLSPDDHQRLDEKMYPDLQPLNFQGIYRTSQQNLSFYSIAIRLNQAKLDIRNGKAQDGLSLLDDLIASLDETTNQLIRTEVLVQAALAHHHLGHEEEAYRSLREAIDQVAPESYLQIFIREGLPMLELMARTRDAQGHDGPAANDFIALVMAEIGARGSASEDQPAPFGLTPREIEVIRCLALGASYTEAADQLFVSVNTLKTHCKRIYSKLDVGNRTQAINRAKELGLLPSSPVE